MNVKQQLCLFERLSQSRPRASGDPTSGRLRPSSTGYAAVPSRSAAEFRLCGRDSASKTRVAALAGTTRMVAGTSRMGAP